MKPVENAARQAQELEGIVPTVNLAAEEGRKDFYGRAKTQHLAPLWRVLHGLVTEKPVTRCVRASSSAPGGSCSSRSSSPRMPLRACSTLSGAVAM